MLFFSFFKTLVGKEIAVELKNDVVLTGTLHSVDQYLNIKLTNVSVVNENRYPQLTALKNCFIRGSVVRYVQINPSDVDTELLQDATRKENSSEITAATTSSSVEVKSWFCAQQNQEQKNYNYMYREKEREDDS